MSTTLQVFMVLMVVTHLIAAIMLYFSDRQQVANRWSALFVLGASLGALGYVYQDTIIPRVLVSGGSGEVMEMLWVIQKSLFVGSNYLCPYGVLMFALTYSGWVSSPKSHRWTAGIAFVPILLMWPVTNIGSGDPIDFSLLFVWAAPYFLGSCFILLVSYWRETHPVERRNRRNMAFILIPPILATVFLNNTLRIFYGDMELFRYFPVFAVIAFVVYGVFLYVDGVLGIRIRVERQTISDQLKAIATSSSMLNHAIRNRLAIMDLSLDHIHVEATKHQLPVISQYADVAMLEIKQMQSMIERIHKQLNEIRVLMKPVRCSELVNSIIEGFQQLPMASRIVIHRAFAVDPLVSCDEAHVSELILNLLKNAAEAMGIQGGTTHIRIERDRKGIMIAVSDNGPGIPKQDVSRVFEPFYSTKKRNANFGLGLTYCYMVAQAHEGTLSVASEQGKGTTFTLRLPKKSIISDEFELERVIEREVG